MGQFKYFIGLTLIFAACAKEEVTKVAPASPISTPQPIVQNQAEGTINGGGGKGVRCQQKEAITVETLDLYEAKVLYNLDIVQIENSQDQALTLIASLLSKHLWHPGAIPMEEYQNKLREMLIHTWLKNIRFIDSKKKLKLINDSFEPLVEDGCELVQVAAYYDESILLVDKSLWDKMDWLNRASLLAHELIYYIDRQNGSTNSMASRKLVGQLFSKKGARPKADGIPLRQSQYARCYLSNKGVIIGYFFAFNSLQNDEAGLELVFNFLQNEMSLFRTSSFLPTVTLESFKNKTTQTSLVIDSYPIKKNLKIEFTDNAKGFFYIIDNSQGKLSEPFDLTCDLP